MRWRKPDAWKIGIAITGILLLLLVMEWISVSVAGAHEDALGQAQPRVVTVQATPTEDATVTALSKEKLAQEVQQLKDQNEPNLFVLLRINASLLFSTLVVVGGGLFGFWRWRVDRRDAQDKELKDRQNAQDKELEDRKIERGKRAEERFHSVVTKLEDEKEGSKIAAAILLRTFLRPSYEQFYQQIFDLAVAHLRLRHVDADQSKPPDTLSQALIVVFREAFPRARDDLSQAKSGFNYQSLDASYVRLDNAFLVRADLKKIFLLEASLIGARLNLAKLSETRLMNADLSKAQLMSADLSKARLMNADLSSAVLPRANLSGADLTGANLSGADLTGANLSGADLTRSNLSGADLTNTRNIQTAYLKDTDLRGVTGLTEAQLTDCKTKEAIIDEESATNTSQSIVTSLPPAQSDSVQAASAPSPQESTSPSDLSRNTTVSSQQESES